MFKNVFTFKNDTAIKRNFTNLRLLLKKRRSNNGLDRGFLG